MNDMQQPQIARDQPLSVTLAAAQWEIALAVLAKGPYEAVAPLIATIQQQCMAAAAPPQEYIPKRGNGVAGALNAYNDQPAALPEA
jgi:hypothetical protein